MPAPRNGIGDDPGRKITVDFGYLEYRIAPGYMAEIVNIEVDNHHRREGVGRKMVNILLFESQVLGVKAVYVITRLSNLIAREFYEGLGFVEVAMLQRFYPGGDSNAVMYRRDV